MLRIGQFARLAQVPVKTLRYYDERGLLTPERIDEVTGYRYYSANQVPRLNRILALKDLGFSLGQVAQVLDDGITHEQLRGMLMLKRAETEHRLTEEAARLSRIEKRLREIEMEGHMVEEEVVIKNIKPMLVAACRIRVPMNDMVPRLLGEAYDHTYDHVRTHGAKALDPCLALWHTTADTYEDEDTEAVVPVDRALPENGRVKVYELAGGTFASATHRGVFEDFGRLHPILLRWIDTNGYTTTGPTREVYHQHGKNGAESVIEIQYPITPA